MPVIEVETYFDMYFFKGIEIYNNNSYLLNLFYSHSFDLIPVLLLVHIGTLLF